MMGFVDSCKPLLQRINGSPRRGEIILLGISMITLIITLTVYITATKDDAKKQDPIPVRSENGADAQKPNRAISIYVHVSGAVVNPDVYKLRSGTRVYQAVERAGGFSEQAATLFISRNINFARIMSDQEKIYIPTYEDLQNGHISEYSRIINDSFAPSSPQLHSNSTELININSSPIEELDSLPGIGPALGQKIIEGRPYTSIDELVVKKIINDSVFQKIKQSITTLE